MDWLNEARNRIPITQNLIYLDNAGAGPLPRESVEAAKSFLEKWMLEGEPWEEGLRSLIEAKRLFAELVNAEPHEIAAVPGATYGFNAFLSALPFNGGGNIVVADTNFPTTYYSLHGLRKKGFIREIRYARSTNGCVPIDEYERLVDDNTVLVVVDYVSWVTGCRVDLKAISEIAHSHNALIITDAFHAVGVIPVDVKAVDVDVLVTGTYKWLLAPHGAGFVYVSRKVLDILEPSLSGWMGIEDSVIKRMLRGKKMFDQPFVIEDLIPANDASMLEWGTWPLLSFEATRVSLNLIRELDAPGRYEQHTRLLVEHVMEGLTELGYDVVTPIDAKAAIVVFRHPRPYKLAQKLKRRHIVVSARPGVVRVSPHFYNTMEEIDAFLQALREEDKPANK